jgi:ribosomal protein S18 acetylase RimI-like enzyme
MRRGTDTFSDETPELGMAILPEYRGRGIGTAIIQRLLDLATTAYAAVSLSVSVEDPALRLYERMGFERAANYDSSLTMLRRLRK